ncbi:hypothetical protein C8R47DRAFT_1201673 [Mycena vitilis]|nr:hypothetical protein C8R47DRAFT_1201673 [Mycena vitilis]
MGADNTVCTLALLFLSHILLLRPALPLSLSSFLPAALIVVARPSRRTVSSLVLPLLVAVIKFQDLSGILSSPKMARDGSRPQDAPDRDYRPFGRIKTSVGNPSRLQDPKTPRIKSTGLGSSRPHWDTVRVIKSSRRSKIQASRRFKTSSTGSSPPAIWMRARPHWDTYCSRRIKTSRHLKPSSPQVYRPFGSSRSRWDTVQDFKASRFKSSTPQDAARFKLPQGTSRPKAPGQDSRPSGRLKPSNSGLRPPIVGGDAQEPKGGS